jgi:peptidyl-tRNA hydrolase
MASNQPIFYIVVNEELHMSPGKIASQVSHITNIITEELVSKMYEDDTTNKQIIEYAKWKLNPVTIVLKAQGSRLNKLLELDNARAYEDSGKTTQNTCKKITVIGFLPCAEITNLLQGYDLLN